MRGNVKLLVNLILVFGSKSTVPTPGILDMLAFDRCRIMDISSAIKQTLVSPADTNFCLSSCRSLILVLADSPNKNRFRCKLQIPSRCISQGDESLLSVLGYEVRMGPQAFGHTTFCSVNATLKPAVAVEGQLHGLQA